MAHLLHAACLGRIIKRVPLQLYPDTFLAEPEISPAQVAAMVGYDARANELFELHVAIMGYYEQATGSFINPGFRRNRASRFSWPMMRCSPPSSAASARDRMDRQLSARC